MDRFLQDVRLSVRSLLRHRGFSVVALVTLALGIGATTAIFSAVRGILLNPLPYPDSDRIVSLWQTDRRSPRPSEGGSVSHVNFLDWKRQARSFETMALYSRSTSVLTGLGEAEVVPAAVVTPGFFDVFRATPPLGRDFTEAEDRPGGGAVVIISEGFWRERFGGRQDILGQKLEISGRPREIVGVAPRGFDFPNRARFWFPVQADDAACGRGCVYLDGVARLRPGVSLATSREEMRSIASGLEREYPDANTNVTAAATTLQDEIVGEVRPALLVIFAAVLAVLLIACANVANLLLVRGAARQGEMAIRAALGASRLRLVRYLLTESALLSIAAAACGLIVAAWGIDILKLAAPSDIPRLADVGVDRVTFFFALGVTSLSAVAFGLVPAVRVARAPLGSSMTGRGTQGDAAAGWSRGALVVSEVALTLMLLLGAGLLVRTLVALQSVDTGFASADRMVFTISLPAARYPDPAAVARASDDLRDRLAGLPGVKGVARISGLPLGPSINVQSFSRTDRPAPAAGQSPNALFRGADSDYFRVVGIPLRAGRWFEPSDTRGRPKVVVISRQLAQRYWPGEDPIGKALRLDAGGESGGVRTIIGVVGDVRSTALTLAPEPELYIPVAQSEMRTFTFVVHSGLPAAAMLSSSRQVVASLDRRLPLIWPGTLQSLVDEQMARPRFYLLLLGVFALVAVVLAVVGVYGVVAYGVSRRTREIGVRMALGADRWSVARLAASQGLRPAALGVGVGAAGAFAAGRAMQGMLYGVQANDPITLTAVVLVTVAVAALACVIPARRAAGLAPSAALRAEG